MEFRNRRRKGREEEVEFGGDDTDYRLKKRLDSLHWKVRVISELTVQCSRRTNNSLYHESDVKITMVAGRKEKSTEKRREETDFSRTWSEVLLGISVRFLPKLWRSVRDTTLVSGCKKLECLSPLLAFGNFMISVTHCDL